MDIHITDREPTINDIKKRITKLNKDISKLAKEKTNPIWNVPNMTQATLLSKYNNRDYSTGPKGDAQATRSNWWGFPGRGGWGANIFPNDVAWWIANKDYTMNGTLGYFYYVYDSPDDKPMDLYWVVDNDGILKVNGKTITGATNVGGGKSVAINIKAGKNVFEFKCINFGGPAGFVFYAYEGYTKKVYFKSGPGWGFSTSPVSDYTMINNTVDYLEKTSKNIYQQIKDIQTLIQNVSPKVVENNTLKELNVTTLLEKLAEAKTTYAALVKEAKIPQYYNDRSQEANIKANSNFNQYVLYLIFTILFLIGLIFVLKNPEAGNLDILMLILGLGILLYYGYEYYMMKQRSK